MAKCKVLFLAANPEATERLALDEEIRLIEQRIRASEYRDSISLVSRWAVRPDDLLQAFNEHKPQIVHFSGHGNSENCLLLQGDDGTTKPVSEKILEKLFSIFARNVRLVLLNACYSESQARSIVKSIECAIGMNTAVGDEAAITFSASFYRAIGFGCNVRDAFEQAKLAVELAGPSKPKPTRGATFGGAKHEFGPNTIPQLLVRDGLDANEIVLASAIPTPIPDSKPKVINRGVAIGGNVTGGSIVTGNQNVINQSTQVFVNNQTNPIDIHVVIAGLQENLTALPSDDEKKIARAFEDINDELQGDKPDRQEIGLALDRALRYASESSDFDSVKADVKTNVDQASTWLGSGWGKLQRHLG